MIICHDWKGRPIDDQDGEYYYNTEYGLVMDSEIEDFITETWGEPMSIQDHIEEAEMIQ
ncbi:hypothetical protein ACWOBX_08190 [Facklamia languida]